MGKWFTVNTLHTLPKEPVPFEIASKSNNNTIGFFGQLNALSNFNKALFEVDGIKFHSSEQFIQCVKASYLAVAFPPECKSLSKSILNYNRHALLISAKSQVLSDYIRIIKVSVFQAMGISILGKWVLQTVLGSGVQVL